MSPINTNDLHRIFGKLDQNGDGFVKRASTFLTFVFFYDVVIKKNIGDQSDVGREDGELESDLAKAFKVYDLNGDGVISCEELQNVLSRLGLWNKHCGRDCKSMINVYDTNSDGVLDFEEFKKHDAYFQFLRHLFGGMCFTLLLRL
ncbi:calcium-binding EF-hand family protein [Actinidia rufa]|uniref:Calcium-binding EF-hand family protein n=1 Tax=Actinidia rufa TaxID=165716 RepID=A0A7J0EGH4_9ERIC|nr:calcium-binding EF-hand family protein [Actinidia rufa]